LGGDQIYKVDSLFRTPDELKNLHIDYKDKATLASQKIPPDTEMVSVYQEKMRETSEQLGEAAGHSYAKGNNLGRSVDASLPGSNAKNNQFDQIYVGDGRLTIIEAKGATNTPKLSGQIDPISGDRYMQGTSKYTQLIIKQMDKYAEKLTGTTQTEFIKTVDLLQSHLNKGTLDYKMVIQKINSDGSLSNVTVKNYLQSQYIE
jgi:hypothetical protein